MCLRYYPLRGTPGEGEGVEALVETGMDRRRALRHMLAIGDLCADLGKALRAVVRLLSSPPDPHPSLVTSWLQVPLLGWLCCSTAAHAARRRPQPYQVIARGFFFSL